MELFNWPHNWVCRHREQMSNKRSLKIRLLIKLLIVPGIVVMFESVVVVQAGHRGVVLYVGAVENRVLGEDYNRIELSYQS